MDTAPGQRRRARRDVCDDSGARAVAGRECPGSAPGPDHRRRRSGERREHPHLPGGDDRSAGAAEHHPGLRTNLKHQHRGQRRSAAIRRHWTPSAVVHPRQGTPYDQRAQHTASGYEHHQHGDGAGEDLTALHHHRNRNGDGTGRRSRIPDGQCGSVITSGDDQGRERGADRHRARRHRAKRYRREPAHRSHDRGPGTITRRSRKATSACAPCASTGALAKRP